MRANRLYWRQKPWWLHSQSTLASLTYPLRLRANEQRRPLRCGWSGQASASPPIVYCDRDAGSERFGKHKHTATPERGSPHLRDSLSPACFLVCNQRASSQWIIRTCNAAALLIKASTNNLPWKWNVEFTRVLFRTSKLTARHSIFLSRFFS